MAIIDVPYVVEMNYATDNRQWSKIFGAVGAFEIPELANAEAPVATRWKSNSGVNRTRTNSTRWFDNSHWIPLEFADRETELDIHLTLEAYQLMIGRRFTTKSELDGFTPLTKKLESSKLAEYVGGKIPELATWKWTASSTTSSHEYVLQNVQAAIDDLIIVDKHLWTRCPEPILVNKSGANFNSIIVTAKRPDGETNRSFFRLDRLDDMLDHHAFENPEAENINHPSVDIFISESINFDDEKYQLIATAHALIDASKDHLHQVNYESAKCWYDLNETSFKIAKNDYDDLELLLRLTEEVSETFLPFNRNAESLKRRVHLARHRWDLKPMDLNALTL